jgi:hypothetical protein
MSNFDVSIILRMVDQLTGPARRAQQAVRGMGQTIRQAASSIRSGSRSMERPFVDALNRMQRKAVETAGRIRQALSRMTAMPAGGMAELRGQVGSARGALMGSALMAAALMLPFKGLANAELELTKIGQISQWKPQEFAQNLAGMNDTLRGVADETRQSFTTIAQGMNFLVASGLPADDSVKGIRSIGKAATATHADIEDLSKMAYALRQNLGIAPEQWEEAFGIAHLGGKLGAFELKDAARWFPELTTDMQFLGQTGLKAVEDLTAFLQIVRQGAGTSDIAANNLANVFQKIFTKETAKNFKKYAGIDFKKEMMGARDRGENPLFKLLELIDQYSKGEAFQIGDLFVDRQALNAIKILIAKRDKLKEMQSDIRAGGGQAQIDADFASSLETLTFQAKGLFISLDKFMNTSFSQVLGETKGVIGLLTGFHALAETHHHR